MKKIVAFIMLGVMMLSLGGCKNNDFDAKGYVKASLDAKFHRDYKAYAKMTGVSEKEAKEQMESEFNESLKASMSEAGIPITDAEMEEYLQLEADIRAKVQYEVKTAKKDKDENYTVQVEITPIPAYEALETAFKEKLTTAVQNGATENQYMASFLEAMKECVANTEAGESVKVTLSVKWEEKDKQKVYSIDEKEWLDVDLIATGEK